MSKQLKWLIIIICSILALVLNFTIINGIIMPDPCHYHSNEMNPLLTLFYTTSSASGGHPESNIFNFLFTMTVGGLLGKLVTNLISKKIKKTVHNKLS